MNQTHLFMLLASNKWIVSNWFSVQHISSILWSSNSQIEGFKFSHTIGETEYIYIHTRKLTNLGFVRHFVTWYHKKATH